VARVLVTGGNGFVGSNLVEALLARGDEVTCLVRRKRQPGRLESLGAKIVRFDGLDDREALARAIDGEAIVYHLAGATKVLARRMLFAVNERGARNVAEVCAGQPCPPILIHVSSMAACGPSESGQPRRESDRPSPVSHYGRSKLAGERAVRRLAGQVPTTIVRPAIVLGPADVVGFAMYQWVQRWGLHLVPGVRSARYSIVHVADLCRLLILAAERGRRLGADEADQLAPTQGCYFAAGDECPTWAELGRLVAQAVGRRRVLNVPVLRCAVWATAAAVDTAAHVVRQPFYLGLDKAREITAGSWVCSTQAARDELGFSAESPLVERLKETVAWYREAGWL
jgi:dihydroflavonol-4-reductase